MPALSIGSLTASSGSLSGTVTLSGVAPTYPYIVDFLVNDVNAPLFAGSAFTSSSVIINSADMSANFTISGLTNGTQYSVVAYDINGTVSSSQIGRPSSVPLKPTLSLVSTNEQTVTLLIHYGISQGSDCLSYPIFYRAVDASNIQTVSVEAFSYVGKSAPFTKSITIPSLQMGTQYEFALNTKNSVGLSPLSNTVIATPSNVAAAPGVPVLSRGIASSTNIGEVISTISMPSDAAAFTIFDPSNNIVPPVAKFILYSDISVDGTITHKEHTLDPTVSSTDASGIKHYSGLFTTETVSLQLGATSTKSLSVSVKGRTVMTAENNMYNIIDQESGFSAIPTYFAGNVGMAAPTNSGALKASVTVDPSGNMNKVVVKPSFLAVPDLTGFTNHIRIVDVSNNQTSTLLSNPSSQTFVASLASDASFITFLVTNETDFTKTAKIQVKSSFDASGQTISTRWADVNLSSFGLWSKPDVVAFDILESSQFGAPAFQITANLPTVKNMKGLILRDYVLQAKTTNGAGSTNWVSYDPISNAFDGNIYKSILPDGTPFVKGTSYSFAWSVRGSVTPTSSVISGSAAFANGVLTANAFKTLIPDVVNADTKSTVYLPIVPWVDASGSIPAFSAIINFTEDPSGNNYIPVDERKGLTIVYAVSFEGGTPVDVLVNNKLFEGLTNGTVNNVAIQARFVYKAQTVYSEVYSVNLKPAGVPAITDSSVAHTYSTLAGGVSGSGSAVSYAAAAAISGVIVSSIQSVFSATINNKGSGLQTYTAIYVPKDPTTVHPDQMIVKNVSFPSNFTGVGSTGVLSLTPVSFIAKACILYVTNGNGSTVAVIPSPSALN